MILRPVRPASPVGTADHEATGRIDQELGAAVLHVVGVEHRLDDLFDDGLADGALRELPASTPLGVLSGYDHGAHRDRPVVFVLHRHLRLAVGPQPLDVRVTGQSLPHPSQSLHDPVGQHDGQRHPLASLVGGVAEHHALVAGPLLLGLPRIHAHGDVGRLLVDRGEHRAGPSIEPVGRVGVADVLDGLPHQIGDVHVRGRRDFPCHHRHPGRDQRLARHPAVGVARENRIEDGVGDLIRHLVRMPFGHRFGGEDVAFGSGHNVRLAVGVTWWERRDYGLKLPTRPLPGNAELGSSRRMSMYFPTVSRSAAETSSALAAPRAAVAA